MAGDRVSIEKREIFASAAPEPAPPGLVAALAEHYAIQRRAGRGGMATVYLARDLKYDRDVAIKVLNPELAHAVSSGRFLREIRRTAQLNHPHIVPMLDSGEADGVPYYVMPHMDGGTLRQRLARESKLPVEDAVSICGVIAGALGYAHRHGLIHRDVKPENILFSEGEPYLADFGIARATERSLDESGTSRGLVPGTIAYMSPEQVAGDGEIDERSDIFSLGCVLYESLTGELPFTGPTPQATMTRRLIGPPIPVRELRPDVPEAVETTVMRALAIDVADRFQTAADFKRELTGHSSSGASWARRGTWGRWLAPRSVVMAGAAAGVGLAVWIAAGQPGGIRSGVPADTTHIVAFPLEVEGDTSAVRLDDDLMHQALSRWRGIVVADRFAVADAIRRPAGLRLGNRYSRLAEALGAGRYVRGQVISLGDSLRVYAALYDINARDALHQVTRTIPADPKLAGAGYADLADALLLRGAPAELAPSTSSIHLSLPAIQAFALAQRALDDWDLGAADSAFQSAVSFDEGFARAHLWLAQVRAWRGVPTSRWTLAAERALARPDQLSERERHLATALVHLGKGEYAAACGEYAGLSRRNDRDFAAWFGLGQCRRMDKAVVRDGSSPSGWRFRSSYHEAVRSYTRAFEILPSVHRGYERGAFDRLRSLFLLSTDMVIGHSSGPDSAIFLGRLGWAGDSILLVPYPWQSVFAGGSSTNPPGVERATTLLRNEFRRIANGWSAQFPRSPGAKHAVAISLELLGDRSAIDTLRVARGLTTAPGRKRELAAAEVLLLVKFGAPDDHASLAVARALADSLLALPLPNSAADADLLVPLAALVGRCSEAEQLARTASPRAAVLSMPPALVSDAQAVLAQVAMDCPVVPPTPTLPALSGAIARAYASSGTDIHQRMAEMLLFRPALLASVRDSAVLADLGASSENDILRAARALAMLDTAGARRALQAFGDKWPPALGPLTPDVALPAARLWAAMGDAVTAIALLDRTLGELPRYDPQILEDVAQSAAVVTAMMLRADLAAAGGDTFAARRWGTAATVLRRGADPVLQHQVERMSRYAGAR